MERLESSVRGAGVPMPGAEERCQGAQVGWCRMTGGVTGLSRLTSARSRTISPENRTGAKGAAA
ncbi:MAG TPA: hypothetical protein VGD68_08340, partial [Streptosporangiaceae bacterium]